VKKANEEKMHRSGNGAHANFEKNIAQLEGFGGKGGKKFFRKRGGAPPRLFKGKKKI